MIFDLVLSDTYGLYNVAAYVVMWYGAVVLRIDWKSSLGVNVTPRYLNSLTISTEIH